MRRRNGEPRWSLPRWGERAGRSKRLGSLLDSLGELPRDEARAILIGFVERCKRAGIAADVLTPGEARFMERQYERAVLALAEISAGRDSAEGMAWRARRTVEINHEAETRQLAAAARLEPFRTRPRPA